MIAWLLDGFREYVIGLAQAGFLPSAFEYAFVINAMVAALVLGPVLGGMGTLVVTKRLAFFSEAVGHAALTGVALGILLGEPYTSPYISLFGFCLLFGVALAFTRNRTNMPTDTLIGVFLSISLAVGACLILFVTSRVNIHILDNILFGSILTVNDLDLVVMTVTAILVVGCGTLWYNRMVLATFNPSLARVYNVRVNALDYLFIVMLTVLTVACVKIIGAVLVEALLLIPAAAARNLSRSLKGFFLYSVVFATISCVVGIFVPMQFDIPVPSGGAIILAASVFFLATLVVRVVLPSRREAVA